MPLTKEQLVDLQEKYEKVLKLSSEDTKFSSETDRFNSKYSARDILLQLLPSVDTLLEAETDPKERLRLTGILGFVHLYLAIVSCDVDETCSADTHLNKCLQVIQEYESAPELIMVTLNMYNQFGILWFQRDTEKSRSYLEKAEDLYKNFRGTPLDTSDLFSFDYKSTELAIKNLDKVHTFTLYYLAQIYELLKDSTRSAIYCHITLQRQLESREYDPIDWALNSATLSQVFMEKNSFTLARHHLAASCYILDQYETDLNSINEQDESYLAKRETFNHRSADVYRCWAKYGLLLLSKSKERLMNDEINAESDFDSAELQFSNLDLSKYEAQITCNYLLTKEDARPVFQSIQTWLNKAKMYYSLENLASDHIQLVQDQSQMYFNYLFFEENAESQAKLHKRRIDLLESILTKINEQYYLQYCREIWMELALIYYDLLNIKSDKLKESEQRPTAHALHKINHLVVKSISHYKNFINSVKNGNLDTINRIEEDLERPLLLCHFRIAALSSKFITLDKEKQLANVETSFQYYKNIYDYFNANGVKDVLEVELGICKQMIELLPVKMAKLRMEIAS